MAFSKALPLVFLVGFLLCLSSPATEAVADFNYLSLMWPGSQCTLLWWCCAPTTTKPAQDFLIEGMFPADSTTGKTVTNCVTTCSFRLNLLQKFIGDMYLYWSDISCPSNNGVDRWKKVWCESGSCSGLTQRDYFNATLNLRTDLDLLYVLQDNDITPSSTNTYSLTKIQQVLAANYGFSTVVMCNKYTPIIGTSQLHKVIFCIAKDGKTSVGCPTSLQTNCDASIKFPLFPGVLSAPSQATTNPIKMPTNRDAAM